MISFKKTLKLIIIPIIVVIIGIFAWVYLNKKINKKSFESELNKNKIERCIFREKNKCNSNKKICMLYDKKDKGTCESKFNICVKQAKKEKC